MGDATFAVESAIRTGGWQVPQGTFRSVGTDGRVRFRRDPHTCYLVFGLAGDRLGCISHSQRRPALTYGGPTYFLKRSATPPT